MNSFVETIIGNEAPYDRIVEIDIGLLCLVKNKFSVVSSSVRTRSEAEFEDHVEEIVVLIEVEADKQRMDMLELLQGTETSLKEAFFDL